MIKLTRRKKNKLTQILKEFEQKVSSLKEKFKESPYSEEILENETDYQLRKNELIKLLDDNLQKVWIKKEKPSLQVELKESNNLIEQVNNEIEIANNVISEYNDKVVNPDEVYSLVKDKFWKLARNKAQAFIAPFERIKSKLNNKITDHKNYIQKASTIIRKLNFLIKERREKVTNTSQSVDWINETSTSLGLIGFEIVETEIESNTYKLIRENEEDEDVFKSLSEGEKTLITFLYFLELITGATRSDESVNLQNRIIVIDDPISSLSHNYVYEVASQIQYKVIRGNFGQVIILTHNLFFLHEVLYHKRNKDAYDLYRLVKHENTIVKEMGDREIQNNYEGYWQSFKDIKESGNYLLAPVVMRNILENYFSFIKRREDLANCIYELEEEYREYKPFLRYLSKESHSDMNTIQDMGEIDPARFFGIFKKIFEKTEYLDHYYTMSEETSENG